MNYKILAWILLILSLMSIFLNWLLAVILLLAAWVSIGKVEKSNPANAKKLKMFMWIVFAILILYTIVTTFLLQKFATDFVNQHQEFN